MGVVDTLIMGRVGVSEQGAVGLGGMLAWTMGVVFVGATTIVITFVAQDFGAGQYDKMRRHVHTALILMPPFAVAVWCLVPFLPDLILLLGTDPTVAGHVETYVSIRILGVPFLLILFAISSFLRGMGDMVTPMVISVAANLINLPLSIILVFGLLGFPAMGVAGVALASLIAQGIEASLCLIAYLGPKNARLFQTRSWCRPTLAEMGKFLKVGLPIGFVWLFDMMAWTLFSIYASTCEPEALAAHMIIFQIMHLSFLPAAAISVAGTTLVGQYLGARRPDLAQKSANKSILLGVAYMTFVGSLMVALREPLLTVFNPDQQVVAVGLTLIVIAAIFQPLDGVGITIVGVLRGAGDTRFPMVAIFISGFLVFLPGVYFLGEYLELGLYGAWLAALVHVTFFAALAGWRYRYGAWQTRKL